jgi:diaminohydroxyphosphoribosylaminopyrimidine deaminase/5-amino-6-(5-phosphoribosylamino)uracil reductase
MTENDRATDERYMRMAISLAERGTGCVSPNPRVGCVLVKDGSVVGWGYHKRYGGPHAEVEALRMAGSRAEGATAYVNLEPCSHHGKTPPCAPQLASAGIVRVVSGMRDPNRKVNGSGLSCLERAGVQAISGVLEEDCKWLNRGFIRTMTLNRPWVTVKAAMSLDGDIALASGESKWISGPLSRSKAHLLRSEHDAVLVGVGTILTDDPELTVRLVEGKSPLRVVLDSNLRTPPSAKVVGDGRCLFLAGADAPEDRATALENRGAKILRLPQTGEAGRPSIEQVLSALVAEGISMLLVEGGSSVISTLIKAHAVDEYSLFVAPVLLGRGLQLAGELSLAHMGEAVSLSPARIKQVEGDLWLEVNPKCSPAL